MSTKVKRTSSRTRSPRFSGYTYQADTGGFFEYTLKRNGLRVLHRELSGTGVVTSNLTYRVGSRHEPRGKTGLAHMLEHMLFMPTTNDAAADRASAANRFEQETGALLNANTSRDRTTYYFSYPREHFDRALAIEADRMRNVRITEENFAPERNNVLSEFDMYFSRPDFVLAMRMSGVAFHTHPYGHEVIGFRDDIERYEVADLCDFYDTYYRPDNATLTIVGDVSLREALRAVERTFGELVAPERAIPDFTITEAQPEGERTVTVTRESNQNLLALGVRHAGFPSQAWHRTFVALSVLAGGPESILERSLVDTGLASNVEFMLEPTRDENLAIIFITLAPGVAHDDVLTRVRQSLDTLDSSTIAPLARKVIAGQLTEDAFVSASSLQLALELTEYVAADAWQTFLETESILTSITPSAVMATIHELFQPARLTLGRFIGTQRP